MIIHKNYSFITEGTPLPRPDELPAVITGNVFADGLIQEGVLTIRQGYGSQSAGRIALLFPEAELVMDDMLHNVQGFLEDHGRQGIVGNFYEFSEEE